jgi:hypothetical protein
MPPIATYRPTMIPIKTPMTFFTGVKKKNPGVKRNVNYKKSPKELKQ